MNEYVNECDTGSPLYNKKTEKIPNDYDFTNKEKRKLQEEKTKISQKQQFSLYEFFCHLLEY